MMAKFNPNGALTKDSQLLRDASAKASKAIDATVRDSIFRIMTGLHGSEGAKRLLGQQEKESK